MGGMEGGGGGWGKAALEPKVRSTASKTLNIFCGPAAFDHICDTVVA